MSKVPELVAKDYQIMHKINEGAFGQIFKGINRKTGQEVAVKF
jgi:serine/threonine protein kinase